MCDKIYMKFIWNTIYRKLQKIALNIKINLYFFFSTGLTYMCYINNVKVKIKAKVAKFYDRNRFIITQYCFIISFIQNSILHFVSHVKI